MNNTFTRKSQHPLFQKLLDSDFFNSVDNVSDDVWWHKRPCKVAERKVGNSSPSSRNIYFQSRQLWHNEISEIKIFVKNVLTRSMNPFYFLYRIIKWLLLQMRNKWKKHDWINKIQPIGYTCRRLLNTGSCLIKRFRLSIPPVYLKSDHNNTLIASNWIELTIHPSNTFVVIKPGILLVI